MKYCPSCGAEINGASFCSSCGTAVSGANPSVNVSINAPASSVSGPPCPRCLSHSTELADVKGKKISGGKLAAGLLTGGLSCLATGFKTKQKVTWLCRACSRSFVVAS